MFNIELLFVSQYGVTMFASANRPSVYHVAYEDTAIAYLACMSHIKNYLYRRIYELIAANNRYLNTLNHVR